LAFASATDEALKALVDPDVKEHLAKLGAESLPMEQDAFNASIRTELESAARIAKAADLRGP
jgi:tripartite-type tricarboxylate transporter receptor subunit TctC